MAVTRINNNQITDAANGNVLVGINAGTKIQPFSITATRIANNLTYGSDLTITGNLTVSGTTTNVDTVNTLIQDPLITLADGQTSGAPTLDIGTIGLRGSENSAVLAWKESQLGFVTALSNTTVSNTTFNINSYANLQTGNFTVQGTTSLVGNIIGAVNATDTITGGNLATAGTASAGGNITGGNLLTGGLVSATSNITGGNVLTGGEVSATGNGTFGNISTAGSFNVASISASGNITGGNLLTGGLISAGGNVSAGNVSGTNLTGTNVSVTGTATAASTVGGVITGTSTSVTGTQTAASTVGGVITGTSVSVTGGVDAASVAGGVITGTSTSVTGTQTAASTVGGVITGTSSSVTGTQTAASTVGGVITGSSSSVTGTQTAASTVGGVITGSSVSVTGNVTGGNVITDFIYSTGNTTLTINAQTISLNPVGNVGMNSRNINNLANPSAEQDAATKIYVDTVAQGLDPKASVVYATTANLAPYTYNNGSSGVGATLTLTSAGNLTIDGNIVASGERVLIKDEVGAFVDNTTQSAAFNGIYVVTTAGAPGVAAVLTRATDFDNGSPSGEIPSAFTFVEAGTYNADTGWVCTTNAPVTVGTTQIIFAQFSGAGSYTAGNALSLNGTQFNVNVDSSGNATIGINGSNQLIIPAGAVLTTPNIGAATGTSVSVTGGVTAASVAGGVITGTSASVTGGVTAASVAGGVITGSSSSVTGTQTAASTVGGVITGSSVSVTGGVTAASVAGGVITGTSTSVTGTQTAASTVGGVITGSSSSVTGTQTAASTVGGVITGSSTSVTGTQTAASTVGGVITGSSVSVTGNVDAGNVQTGGLISGTGNVTGGNVLTGGLVSATANVTGGNLLTGGLISATANITGNNVVGTTSGQFGNIVISGDDITDTNGRVNINTAGADVDFAVNGDTVANVFYVDAGTGTASFGSSTQTTNALVAFNTTTSILLPAGNLVQRPATGVTGMMRFNSTSNSLEIYNNVNWTSVGATVFTVITDEQFNGDGVTTQFTLANASTTASTIVSINGVLQIPTSAYSVSNVTLTFTEAPASADLIDVRALTTTSTVLSIQNVSGNASVGVSDTSKTVAITGDLTVSGNATVLGNVGTNLILNGSSRIEIPDANGNIHFDINSANDVFNIGQFNCVFNSNASPAANVTFDLGTTTKRWKDLYLAGNSIVLGNTVIKNTSGNSIGFFGPDGTTAATIDAASVDTTTIVNGTSNVKVLATNGNISVAVGGSGIVTFTSAGIINNMGNAVGNIGNATSAFNTIFAKATSAQYADLAEKYTADAEYAPGTVVVFGGTAEVTVNAVAGDTKVAGVVSTNPSYTMNSGLEAEHVATVALTGRVPTMVIGPVRKGDLMVAAGLGRAQSAVDPKVGSVIGKALEDFDGAEGTIEVVVGRF